MDKTIKTVTIEEVSAWVNGFNQIPTDVVAKLMQIDIESVRELTTVEEDEYPEYLPMWGTMWTLSDSLLEEWIKENIEIMQELGFRVYESEDLGILLGIDGAGYSFYEAHWIPLYTAYYTALKKES